MELTSLLLRSKICMGPHTHIQNGAASLYESAMMLRNTFRLDESVNPVGETAFEVWCCEMPEVSVVV